MSRERREQTKPFGQKLREWALNGGLAVVALLAIVLAGSALVRAILPPKPGSGASDRERKAASASLSPDVDGVGSRAEPPAKGVEGREIRIQVLNGCGVPGAGSGMASVLRLAGGMDVVEIGNADQFDFESSLVLDRTGNPALAERVSRILDGAPVIKQRQANSPGDVTVIVGYDRGRWLAPLPTGGGR